MLKLIPQEKFQNDGAKMPKRNSQKTKNNFQTQLNEVDLKAEHHLLKKACFQMVNYVKGIEAYGAKEIDELIHQLQRSVLSLQKTRMKLLHIPKSTQQLKKRKK